MIILRKIQIQRKTKKQHQAAVTAILMFLKKVSTLSTSRNIIFDCLKNLESKVNVISVTTNAWKKTKGEKQLIDLAETTNFLSVQLHEFEADRKLKEEIINSLCSQGSVLHDDLKKIQAQLNQQPQYSRMNYLLFHRIKDEKGEDADSIITNIVNEEMDT